MKFVPNVAGNSETRIGAATVRERLAASTRLIRQRPRSPFWLRLVRVRAAAHGGLAAFWRKKRGAAIRGLSPAQRVINGSGVRKSAALPKIGPQSPRCRAFPAWREPPGLPCRHSWRHVSSESGPAEMDFHGGITNPRIHGPHLFFARMDSQGGLLGSAERRRREER